MIKPRKIPNPHGRLGGPKHKGKVKEVGDDIAARGFLAVFEAGIDLISGRKRFADVIAQFRNGKIAEIHQIGVQNANGTPVKREQDAMKDMEEATGIKPIFHPYNLIITVLLVLVVATYFTIKHYAI